MHPFSGHFLGNLFLNLKSDIQAEGLTAMEAWVIACIVFVFAALMEYTGILLQVFDNDNECENENDNILIKKSLRVTV